MSGGWKYPVYPIKFSFGDSKTINTDGDKMIQSATIQKSSVESGNHDVPINELKSKYYLLINGPGTVTNGGKSRRRRQTKNKRKSRRTRRSRK